MATALNSTFEIILYPTRATRSTTEFSRATVGGAFPLLHHPEQKSGRFRLSVTWGTDEAFTISNLANAPAQLETSVPVVLQVTY